MRDQNTREFVLCLLSILVDVPRVWRGNEDCDHALKVLEIDEIQEKYQALSDEERAKFDELWEKFQGLMQRQSEIHAAASHLSDELTNRLVRSMSYRETCQPEDAVMKGTMIHGDLAQIIEDMPLRRMAVLLKIARRLHQRKELDDESLVVH